MKRSMQHGLGVTLGIVVFSYGAAVRAQQGPPPEPVIVVVPVEPAPPPPPVYVPVAVPVRETVVLAPVQRSETVTESRSGPGVALITGGFIAFGVSYGAAVIVAATSERDADKRLYIPILGPWLDLGDRGSCDVNESACDGETTNKVLLVVDGVFQGVGLLSVVGGILSPSGNHSSRSTTSVTSTGVHLMPVSYGRGTPGLVAFGSF